VPGGCPPRSPEDEHVSNAPGALAGVTIEEEEPAMPPSNPRKPAKRVETDRTMVATSGIRINVKPPPPPEPPKPRREEPVRERMPRAIIFPPGQPIDERAAFIEQTERQWGPFITAELRRSGVPPQSTEDLQQKVLVILCKHYDANDQKGPDNVPAWLDKVIGNQVRNYRRLRRLAVELGVDLDVEVASAPDPERAAMLAELKAKLRRYLDELTPEELEVFEARELDGKTYDDIAATVDRHRSTVIDQHKRAMQKLRDLARASERRTRYGAQGG
jgi:RNA polymerase sigma factor (sigma-70 family)